MRFFNRLGLSALCLYALPALGAESDDALISVNIETPGSLGVEILYQVDRLADVKQLKVTGQMNANDWETIGKITELKSLDLSAAVTTAIPEYQFSQYAALEEIKLPSTLTGIGSYAFRKTSLKTLTLPAALRSIEDHAFYTCSNLTQVSFEEGCELTNLGSSAFYSCGALETIELPDKLQTIGDYAFYNCSSLSTLGLPSELKIIESAAFRGTGKLSLVDFPETLKSIYSDAFRESGLESVVLPNGVSYIGSSAFYNCSNLTELVLPGEVLNYTRNSSGSSSISSVFSGCKSLKSITCLATTPPVVEENTFYNVDLSQVTLHVPDFSIVNYKLADGWLSCGTIVGDVKSSEWYVKGDLSLSNNRRMEGSPSVTLADGATLTVGGVEPMPMASLRMTADFTKSTWTYPQFINGSAAMTAQKVATEITVSANRWYFVTLPYEVSVSEIAHSDSEAAIAVRHYDGALRASDGKGGWQDETGIMHEGQGYIIQTNKAGTITFPAHQNATEGLFYPNAKVKELAANPSEDPANAGWNFMGNPWQSYYDMYYTMLTAPVIIWNHSDRNYEAFSLIDDDVVLRPYQTFFIQATDDIKEMEFGTAGRQFGAQSERPATRAAAMNRELYNLEMTFNGLTDRTRVVVNPDASIGYEPGMDAAKFFSDDSAVPQLYTVSADGDLLSINERPLDNGVVRLGYFAPEAAEVTLSLPKAAGEVEITDLKTGESAVIAAGGTFRFSADAGSCDDRLTLRIMKPLSGVDAPYSAAAEIICDGAVIGVKGENGMNVTIVSLEGLVEVNETIADGNAEYRLPSGIHIVKAGGKTMKCVIK